MGGAIDLLSSMTQGGAWVATVLLLSLRLGAALLMTPVLAAAMVPATVRVLLILGLSAALSLGLPSVAATPAAYLMAHPGALIQAGFTEVALGSTLGLGILLAFSAFTLAGRALDIQIGFGLGQVIDPSSNSRAPILTTAFNQVALVVFFLVNGHHALMRGLAYSLERFPLGQPWPIDAAVGPVLKQVAGMFSLSFVLAAPVVFCILMTDLALGVLARNLPQINMLTMGIPVKIVVGIFTLSLWFAGIGPVMTRVYGSIYRTWDAIFAAAPPQPRMLFPVAGGPGQPGALHPQGGR
ncbi:MAG TPA: flagellar biosynthetic protein FliR [Geothrix sp.]|nr:flagellar biosynthetic protein FliR [Geothrix sp.]